MRTEMKDCDVVVVGAGLTGLRAALEITNAGLSVMVLDRNDQVGGRMRTSTVGGFQLDHGFQVILSAYPELRRIPGLALTHWRPFFSGARVRAGDRFVDFMDPRRHPEFLFAMLRSPICSISDLIRFFFLLARSPRATPNREDQATADLIQGSRFSGPFREKFLLPFLRGVLLDPTLRADAGMARFYLRMFGAGDALLPPLGIQELPQRLAAVVGQSHIRLGVHVKQISARHVVLENGETLHCDQVICATDTLSAAALGSSEQTMPHSGGATLYFGAQNPPFSEPLLVLNGEGGPISILAVPSNVQPKYAPVGRALISVVVLGEHARASDESLLGAVRKQLCEWYGNSSLEWEFLQRFDVPNALPSRPRMGVGWTERAGILYAGDYLSYPSQNGALAAGRQVGEAVIAAFS